MKKPRELFETELAEIREKLLRLGLRPRENPTERAASVKSEEQIVTPPAMMTAAYGLAGYAVATRALGRSMPDKVVLKEDSEYDLGTCSEPEIEPSFGVIPGGGGAQHLARLLGRARAPKRAPPPLPLHCDARAAPGRAGKPGCVQRCLCAAPPRLRQGLQLAARDRPLHVQALQAHTAR